MSGNANERAVDLAMGLNLMRKHAARLNLALQSKIDPGLPVQLSQLRPLKK